MQKGHLLQTQGQIDYENESGTRVKKNQIPTIVTLTDGGFKVLKVDASNTATTLAGAEFKLTDEKIIQLTLQVR